MKTDAIPSFIQNMLSTKYPFNPANRPVPVSWYLFISELSTKLRQISYTDEQLESMLGLEEFRKLMENRRQQMDRIFS